MHNVRLFWSLVPALFTSSVMAQANTYSEAVSPDVLALRTTADLVAKDVGFTSLGEVTFSLYNRGDVGINISMKNGSTAPTLRGAAPAHASGQAIKVDIYIGGVLGQSVYQASLAGKASKVFVVKLQAGVPHCLETRNIKVVIDQQNVIQELHDDNNEVAQTAARPCPDLAVLKIEREKQGVLGEMYQPKVTIINLGNAPSPPTEVWGTALTRAPGITGWPELKPTHTIPALAPGQTTSFRIGGSVLSADNSWVRIMLDRFFHIEESDESNNFKEKVL